MIQITAESSLILDIHDWLDNNAPGWKYVGIDPETYRERSEDNARNHPLRTSRLILDLLTKNHIMLFKLTWANRPVRIIIV